MENNDLKFYKTKRDMLELRYGNRLFTKKTAGKNSQCYRCAHAKCNATVSLEVDRQTSLFCLALVPIARVDMQWEQIQDVMSSKISLIIGAEKADRYLSYFVSTRYGSRIRRSNHRRF